MKFSGKNLEMVRRGVDLAIDELHNQIATCPDVFEYADELDDLEKEKAKFEKLRDRIDEAIAQEQEHKDDLTGRNFDLR